jgi:hypothetical protein
VRLHVLNNKTIIQPYLTYRKCTATYLYTHKFNSSNDDDDNIDNNNYNSTCVNKTYIQ